MGVGLVSNSEFEMFRVDVVDLSFRMGSRFNHQLQKKNSRVSQPSAPRARDLQQKRQKSGLAPGSRFYASQYVLDPSLPLKTGSFLANGIPADLC